MSFPFLHGLHALLQFCLKSAINWPIVRSVDSEVILIDTAFVGMVSVFVAFAVYEPLGSLVVGILQVSGNRQDASFPHVLHGFVDRDVGGV